MKIGNLAALLFGLLSTKSALATSTDEAEEEFFYDEFTRCSWTLETCDYPQVRKFFHKHCAVEYDEGYPSTLLDETINEMAGVAGEALGGGGQTQSLFQETSEPETVTDLAVEIAADAGESAATANTYYLEAQENHAKISALEDKAEEMKDNGQMTEEIYGFVQNSLALLANALEEAADASAEAARLASEATMAVEDVRVEEDAALALFSEAELAKLDGNDAEATQKMDTGKIHLANANDKLEVVRGFLSSAIQEERRALVAKIKSGIEAMEASSHVREQVTANTVLPATVLSAQAAFASLDTIKMTSVARENIQKINKEIRSCKARADVLALQGTARKQFKEILREAKRLRALASENVKEAKFYIKAATKSLKTAIRKEEKAADKMEAGSEETEEVQALLDESAAEAAAVMVAISQALAASSQASAAEIDTKFAIEQLTDWLDTAEAPENSRRNLRGNQGNGPPPHAQSERRLGPSACPDYCHDDPGHFMCIAVCKKKKRRRELEEDRLRRHLIFEHLISYKYKDGEYCQYVNMSMESLVKAIMKGEKELGGQCQTDLLESGFNGDEANPETVLIEWCVAVSMI